MYDCRRTLLNKYIREFNYKASLYFERLYELPLPPLLFFSEPFDGKVMGVHEQELYERRLPLYKIAAHSGDDPRNQTVFAGMTSLPGTEPSIRFDVADVQLAYAYFYNAAFEGKKLYYTPVVDEMYEKALRGFGI